MGKHPKKKANPRTRAKAVAAIFAMSFCAAVFSCQKNSNRVLEESTELSKKIYDARSKATWAYEIESGRLSKQISSVDAIDRNIPLNPLTLIALEGGKPMPAVFAEIEGFASLDTTDIQGAVLDTVDGFCRALVEYTSAQHANDSEKDGTRDAEAAGVSHAETDSSKIDAYFPERTLYSLVLFLADSAASGAVKSFVIGKAFVGEETIEVPVRLSCENATVYALAYPAPYEESWKIQQIEIYKVEEKNGKPHGN